MKLACKDGLSDGLLLEDSLEVAALAENMGLDALEVSGGMRPGFNMRKPKKSEDEGFFLKEAEAFKQRLPIPVISVHGYRTFATMDELVDNGTVDMISLCRPLIREPDLVEQFRNGKKETADCISCNLCVKKRQPLRCWVVDG
jgi:2,4-dienoyl-CoA reductase-like NADH-dependent reductase (Old Yellow Enzyme family)